MLLTNVGLCVMAYTCRLTSHLSLKGSSDTSDDIIYAICLVENWRIYFEYPLTYVGLHTKSFLR